MFNAQHNAAPSLRVLDDGAISDALNQSRIPTPRRRVPKPGELEEQTGLSRLVEATAAKHWVGTRSEPTVRSGLRSTLRDLKSHYGVTEPEDVTPEILIGLAAIWKSAGLARNTIVRRLAALNVMGIKTQGCKPKGQRPLQWWLNPSDKETILNWLRSPHPGDTGSAPQRMELADYIEWTCYTGFRVEETLRLCWREVFMQGADGAIDPNRMSVTVPGMKTAGSHATLPLGRPAAMVYLRRWYAVATQTGKPPPPDGRIFPLSYDCMAIRWRECRKLIGATDISTATLKSLRRSAARYLHVEQGMPLDVVRQYLRHSSVNTTMGYLRLVGGYATDEMRRWL
jgi:integrase